MTKDILYLNKGEETLLNVEVIETLKSGNIVAIIDDEEVLIKSEYILDEELVNKYKKANLEVNEAHNEYIQKVKRYEELRYSIFKER